HPEAVNAIAAVAASSADNVNFQVNSWKQQVTSQPQMANAWLNYYNWLDREKTLERRNGAKKEKLDSLVAASRNYISTTWQYSLMLFLQSNKRDSTALFTALNGSNGSTSLYPYVLQYALIRGDKKLLSEYSKLLNDARPMSAALMEYHSNCLRSTEKHATIYAKGLNDLVPMIVLQEQYHIRPDVKLAYYENPISDVTNSYCCLSLGADVLSQYPNASYTGLLIRLDKTRPTLELQKHLENDFSFSFLNGIDELDENEQLIYRNYLPSFILLYKYYTAQHDQKAVHWKAMLDKLAKVTGDKESVEKIIAK
ncbi:MAG TPA: hypothetical protein VKH37_05345, partial [Ferruginibacter sp.]|nr:hypothetical protein [Ferruginibacter sp.]